MKPLRSTTYANIDALRVEARHLDAARSHFRIVDMARTLADHSVTLREMDAPVASPGSCLVVSPGGATSEQSWAQFAKSAPSGSGPRV